MRVAIALSTFNGERYLPELLESLRYQNWTYWDLWVRDDGSTDGTVDVLLDFERKLSETNPKNSFYLFKGDNIGVVNSFFSLLSRIPDTYSGFAFCDQDDIWHPEKMDRAVSCLRVNLDMPDTCQKPFAYHSRQVLMDGEKKIKKSQLPRHVGFSNALIENQLVGCTLVINRALKRNIQQWPDIQSQKSNRQWNENTNPSSNIIMHDWWCYLLASAFGEIVYDPTPMITFRRHHESTTPVATSRYRSILKRISAIKKRSWSLTHIMKQAVLFKNIYVDTVEKRPCGTLSRDKRESLDELISIRGASLRKRLRYTITSAHRRSGLVDTIVFRLMVLFYRY